MKYTQHLEEHMRQNNTTVRHIKSALGLVLAVTMLTGTSEESGYDALNGMAAGIWTPTADGVYYSDTPITFEGWVEFNDEAAPIETAWESDVMGQLSGVIIADLDGSPVQYVGTLDEGPHTITLRATNINGFAATEQVYINVNAPQPSDTGDPEDTGSEGGDDESDDGGATDDTGTAD
jgi:hypothetical protein